MSAKYRRQTFQPSCPAGGDFYACDYGSRFVGCCAAEPCVNGCEDSLLRPASFLKERYSDLPGALCPGGSLWYKCAGTTPPFFGCCRSNPCAQNGCPSKDHRAATLASNPQEALPYSPIPNPSFVRFNASIPVPSASPSTGSLSPSIIQTATTTALPSGPVSPNSKARIIGGTVGGVIGGALIVIFIGVVFFLYRWRKASKRPSSAFVHPESPDLNMTMASPNFPIEADSRPLVAQIDGSPLAQIDGSPISELQSSPPPIYEFPT